MNDIRSNIDLIETEMQALRNDGDELDKQIALLKEEWAEQDAKQHHPQTYESDAEVAATRKDAIREEQRPLHAQRRDVSLRLSSLEQDLRGAKEQLAKQSWEHQTLQELQKQKKQAKTRLDAAKKARGLKIHSLKMPAIDEKILELNDAVLVLADMQRKEKEMRAALAKAKVNGSKNAGTMKAELLAFVNKVRLEENNLADVDLEVAELNRAKEGLNEEIREAGDIVASEEHHYWVACQKVAFKQYNQNVNALISSLVEVLATDKLVTADTGKWLLDKLRSDGLYTIVNAQGYLDRPFMLRDLSAKVQEVYEGITAEV